MYTTVDVDKYTEEPFHYPQIATRAKNHLRIYQECRCELWLPYANQRNGFSGADICTNCKTFISNDSCFDYSMIQSNLFLHEFISVLLNAHADGEFRLCRCCYESMSADFHNLA